MDEYNRLYARLNQLQELAFFSESKGEDGTSEKQAGEQDLGEQIKEQRIR